MIDVSMLMPVFGVVTWPIVSRMIRCGELNSLPFRCMVHRVLSGMVFVGRICGMGVMFRHLVLLFHLYLDYSSLGFCRRYAKWRIQAPGYPACGMKQAI
jgi:hypothetical protein